MTLLSQETLTFPVAFSRISPFSESSCRRLLDIGFFFNADSFLNNVGEKTQKELDSERAKGWATGTLTYVSILSYSWWQSGNLTSHEFPNRAFPVHSFKLWVNTAVGQQRTLGNGEEREATSLPSNHFQCRSGDRLYVFEFKSFPYFPNSTPHSPAGNLRVMTNRPVMSQLHVPHKTHILHFCTIWTWQACSLVDVCVLSPTDLSVSRGWSFIFLFPLCPFTANSSVA